MATFIVTAPDGQKYKVNAPDDATEQEAIDYLQSQMAQNKTPAPVQEEQPSKPALSNKERQQETVRLQEKSADPLRYAAKTAFDQSTTEDLQTVSSFMKPLPTAAKKEAPVADTYTVGETTQAPDLQSQQFQKRFEESRTVTARKAPHKHNFDDLWNNEKLFSKIQKYAEDKFGDTGKMEEGETKEDFINRFASHMRTLDAGNLITNVTEQTWLNGADPKAVINAGEVYQIFRDTKNFLEPGGGSTLRAIKDYALATLSDPTTLFSAGASRVAANAFLRTGSKAPMLFVPAVEGAGGAFSNTLEQKRDIAVSDVTAKDMQEKIDAAKENGVTDAELKPYQQRVDELNKRVEEGVNVGEAALVGGLSAVLGSAEAVALYSAPHVPTLFTAGKVPQTATGATIESELAARNLTSQTVMNTVGVMQEMNVPLGKTVGNVAIDIPNTAMTPFTTEGKTVNDVITMEQRLMGADPTNQTLLANAKEAQRTGRNLLEQQGSASPIAEMQIKNDVAQQATQLASAIWEVVPKLAPKSEELISDVVDRTLRMIDTGEITEDMLDTALTRSGFDIETFTKTLRDAGLEDKMFSDIAKMDRESVSYAARALQIKSVAQRLENARLRLPAKQRESISKFYNPSTDDAEVAASQGLWGAILKLDRNMIVAMTLNASTVMRNVFGPASGATMGTAKEALETAVFSLGKAIAEKAAGVPITGSIGQAAKSIRKDALGIFYYLNEPVLSQQITEKLLTNNSKMINKLLVTAEEIQKSDLYKVVQIANTPSMLIDKFLRQAAFSNSVEKQLRRQGIDLYADILAKDKQVPKEILQRAIDDALEFTFAKFPTNPVIAALVKGVEKLRPISTAVFPFARFMGFATEWTLNHYNPIRAGVGAKQFFDGISMAKAGKLDEGLGVINQGAEKIGQSLTGAITVLAAYQWRASNQDTPWNIMKSDDGTEVDMKYLFPLNVPFALADWIYKATHGESHLFKMREMVDALIGYKSTVGAQDMLIDKLAEDVSEATTDEAMAEKVARVVGEFGGQWVGRATVPLKQVSDILAAFMRDESIPRDAYVIEGPEPEGVLETAGRSFKQQLIKGVPILKQSLPEYQPPTREFAPYDDTGVLKQLTGLAVSRQKNDIEAEVERLSLKYSDVFKTTGNRTLDSKARKTMATLFMPIINTEISSDFYQNMEKEAQRLYLRKRLGEVQRDAKKYTTDASIAEDLMAKRSPRVLQQEFVALSPELKKLSLQMFERSTGTSFTDSDDYLKYHTILQFAKAIKSNPEIMQKPSNFAAGGMAAKVVKGALKTGAKVAQKSTSEMMQDLEKMAAKKADDVVAPTTAAMDVPTQTEAAIPTKKAELPDLFPEIPPMSKLPPAPMTEPVEMAEPLYKKQYMGTDADSFFSEYPADEVAKAEKQLADMYDEPIDVLMANYPDEFANELAFQVQKNMKVKNKTYPFVEDPDFPETAQLLSDAGIKKSKTKANQAANPFYIDPAVKAGMKANATGKETQGAIPVVTGKEARNTFIAVIKDFRSNVFPEIRSNQSFDGIEDIVLGKAQGEFRAKYQREFNPMNTKDTALFKAIAKKEQSVLNGLRKKHEGEPEIVLYHGSENDKRSMALSKSGFENPQKGPWAHSELELAAPSFTRDINFNFGDEMYGGANPENYVSTKIPVAEYKFLKVNTPPENFKDAGFENAVRAITGDRNSVRPLGIARDSFKEKEDAFVEAEKLMLSRPTRELEQRLEEKYIPTKMKARAIKSDLSMIGGKINAGKTITDKEAAVAYRNIKNLLTTEIENANTGKSRAGLGHQLVPSVVKTLETFDEETLTKLASYLADKGQTDKAYNVARVARAIRDTRIKRADGRFEPPTPEMLKKAQQELIDVSSKFSKGGLASRK